MVKTLATQRFRLVVFMLVMVSADAMYAQTTAFTYQGQLSAAGTPASGSYDLRFALFDNLGGVAQIGSDQTVSAVTVSDGVFTVQLDFGVDAFPGANRFLDIAVRPAGVGSFTALVPRQQISSSPYAIRTLSAATADALSSACVGCVQSAQINSIAGSKVSGTIPAASVPTGSGNYVQNTTAQQAGANFNISGNGTAGSMNVNGAVSLAGISPPATAPAGQAAVYFDTASKKVKVSENGGAFVNLVSGSGATNSIPVWSAGTTLGNSLITQSASGVQLPNNVQLGVGAQGNQVQFGSPNSETGMTIAGTSGRADLRFDGTLKLVNGPSGIPLGTNGIAITSAGNVGIGIEAPQTKLVVHAGGSGGDVNVHTPGGESGLSIIGANRADIRFDGSTLKLLAGTGPGAMAPTNGININAVGNVGIGTVSPPTRLALSGTPPPWTSVGWSGALSLPNVSALGWEADASGQHFGIGQSTGGLYFFRTNSAFNATSSGANYDMQIADSGDIHAYSNAEQARDKGGWVKAMAYIGSDGTTIIRCYNSSLTGSAASSGQCGFTPTYQFNIYTIDFGFQINDRFISVTPRPSGGAHAGANFTFASATSVDVNIFVTDDDAASSAQAAFMVIIF